MHAYNGQGNGQGGGEGDLELEIFPQGAELTVVVRDEGKGFSPRVSIADDASWRLGMPLIASLTDALEVGHGPSGRGTEVRMKFATR